MSIPSEFDVRLHVGGAFVKCEVYGEVHVNSNLSGVPNLTLSFANPSVLNDVRYHPSVRFQPWESHQILLFVPPDGEFKLMSYRVKKLKNTPIYVKPQLTSDAGTCCISVLVGVRHNPGKTIDSLTVKFQVMFSSVLQKRLPAESGINVMCVSPGIVQTNVVRDLPKFVQTAYHWIPRYILNPQEGSRSSMLAATDPQVAKHCKSLKKDESPTCAFISPDCRPSSPSKEAHNTGISFRVWEKTLEMVGLPSDAVDKLIKGDEVSCCFENHQ